MLEAQLPLSRNLRSQSGHLQTHTRLCKSASCLPVPTEQGHKGNALGSNPWEASVLFEVHQQMEVQTESSTEWYHFILDVIWGEIEYFTWWHFQSHQEPCPWLWHWWDSGWQHWEGLWEVFRETARSRIPYYFPVLHSVRCADLQGGLGLEGEGSIAF